MNAKDEIQKLMDQYTRWLKDNTILKQLNDQWVEITTPYLDRHNDCLQLYAKKDDHGYLLTDDGYIISDLVNSGCALDSPKRQELLKITLSGFGVQLADEELIVHATPENFSLRKHNFIQAMLAVNDLFYLATPYVSNLFYEDVIQWLDLSEIRYTPKVKFTGKSGFDHLFDFVIPKPERIVQTVNNPNKDAAEAIIFKWHDTRETRLENSKLFAFLNDINVIVSPSVLDALRIYELEPVLWSEREKSRQMLAA